MKLAPETGPPKLEPEASRVHYETRSARTILRKCRHDCWSYRLTSEGRTLHRVDFETGYYPEERLQLFSHMQGRLVWEYADNFAYGVKRLVGDEVEFMIPFPVTYGRLDVIRRDLEEGDVLLELFFMIGPREIGPFEDAGNTRLLVDCLEVAQSRLRDIVALRVNQILRTFTGNAGYIIIGCLRANDSVVLRMVREDAATFSLPVLK